MMNRVIKTEIKRRTFEGLTNTEKNSSPITSKYYPSKKYALIFSVEFSHGGTKQNIIETYRTKREAEERKTHLLEYGY